MNNSEVDPSCRRSGGPVAKIRAEMERKRGNKERQNSRGKVINAGMRDKWRQRETGPMETRGVKKGDFTELAGQASH